MKVLIPILSVLIILVIVLIVVMVNKKDSGSGSGGSASVPSTSKTEVKTAGKTEDKTKATTEKPTEKPTEEKTEAKTDATTEATTTATTEKTTEPPTEAPKKTLKNDIDKIVKSVKSKKGFQNDNGAQGVVADFNGDGTYEVMILYSQHTNNDYSIRYEIWELEDGSSQMLVSGPLFAEVGGNQGTLGVVKRDGKAYIMLNVESPAEMNFNETIDFIGWAKDVKAPEQAPTYSFTAKGISGDEENGTYKINGKDTPYSDYKAELKKFKTVYELNYYKTPEGDVVKLDDLSKVYGNLSY